MLAIEGIFILYGGRANAKHILKSCAGFKYSQKLIAKADIER
jgi:hypothetical protein